MGGHEQRHANNSELHGCMHPKTLAIAPEIRTAKFELSINMKTAQVLGLETCLEICLGSSKNRPTRSSSGFLLRCMSPLMMLWTAPPPARECHGCGG